MGLTVWGYVVLLQQLPVSDAACVMVEWMVLGEPGQKEWLVKKTLRTRRDKTHHITKTNTPRLQLSTALSYPSGPWSRISGATNPGVPHFV